MSDLDVVVVGAGFAGLHLLHSLRGRGLRTHVIERGSDVGGTWFWNRYPGARCDTPSLFYAYSFDAGLEAEWEWKERYPSQPELLAYLQHVADRFDLRRDISLDTTVESADFDDSTDTWRVSTTGGEITARYVVTAVGCLSAAQAPTFPGLDEFRGTVVHTGDWRPVDVSGLRVGVIGTGSSGIQAIPVLAEQAGHVTVLQRTPNFSLPARYRLLEPGEHTRARQATPDLREQARRSAAGALWDPGGTALVGTDADDVRAELDRRWEIGGAGFMTAYTDVAVDEKANDVVADYVRERIRSIVHDAGTARLLGPHDHPIGTKRICVDTDYYATYNRRNVALVDLREEPIERFTEDGIVVGERTIPLDVVVLATGFDAITGPLDRIAITGPGGTLKEKWEAGPRTYLGLASAGFPNLFTVTGPGSPSVLSNMVVSIEQHVDWIVEAIVHLVATGVRRFEATVEAEDAWVAHVNEVAGRTLMPRVASWYTGANIPGKTRIFMPYAGGVGAYREICDEVAADGYRGFVSSGTTPRRRRPAGGRSRRGAGPPPSV